MSGYTIIKETNKKSYGNKLYECSCNRCGKIKYLRKSDALRAGGCNNCKNRQYFGKISGYIFSHIKYNASKRKIKFNITKELIWNKYKSQNGLCIYTKLPIDFGDSSYEQKHGFNTASLDRVDSNFGYNENNIEWVHKIIQNMKGSLSRDEFIYWCKLVAENN